MGFSSRHRRSGGFTLPETVITLALMGILMAGVGGLGYKSLSVLEDRQFEQECETILSTFITSREVALMAGNSYGSYVSVWPNKLLYTTVENGRVVNHLYNLAHSTIAGKSTYEKVTFSSKGTIGNPQTFTITGRNGRIRYLVLQIATGRIYLSDEKP
jgi:prepilin-type N-terminal cleavage/methylation domain-containing protein